MQQPTTKKRWTAALAGQRTMAINELQSILKNLQDIETQEEELMLSAHDRESQVCESVRTRLYGVITWLLHNFVEASFDLLRYPSLGNQLITRELHPLVS